jgi:hypothetical protein
MFLLCDYVSVLLRDYVSLVVFKRIPFVGSFGMEQVPVWVADGVSVCV